MSYNGWSNYETWAVALWLDNDEASQSWAYGVVRRSTSDYAAADHLREAVTLHAPDLGGTLWADLLGAALESVDWLEVAQHFHNDESEDA